MLELTNYTPYAAARSILRDVEARQVWVVVVKATFAFEPDGEVTLAGTQEDVALCPEPYGDPTQTSLRRDSEVVFAHPGTDIVVNGSAHAPAKVPVASLDVAVQVGDVQRTLRVFGDRRWERGLRGLGKSRPAVFTAIPLRYEHAFGGADGEQVHDDNPVGVGFFTDVARASGAPLPNVEDPARLIDEWDDRPPLAGLGALASHWGPRRALAGTYGADWLALRAPLWPRDLDPRHFSCAAPGLWSARSLRGGERVTLTHLHPERPVLTLQLPRIEIVVHTFFGQRRLRQRVQLDRVVIEPDNQRLVLQWGSRLACAQDVRGITRSVVTTKRVLQWT